MSNSYVLGADPTTTHLLSGIPTAPSTSYISPGMGLFTPFLPYGSAVSGTIASSLAAGATGSPTVLPVTVASSCASTITTTSNVGAIVSPLSTAPATTAAAMAVPTISWSAVAAASATGSATPATLPKHTFVFSPLPGTPRTTIDHGVSFNVPFRGVSNDEFLDAVALTVPAIQITDISRVAGTVQIFFRDPSWARQLLASGLDMRNTHLEALPVGVSPKRIILSDVPPHFPDAHVRAILATYGDVRGQIVSLPAATASSKYNHVRTNRRAANVVFATDQDFLDLPSQLAVCYDKVDYVFFVNNPVKCFHCTIIGHTAQACPKRAAQLAAKQAATTSTKSAPKSPPSVPPTSVSVATPAVTQASVSTTTASASSNTASASSNTASASSATASASSNTASASSTMPTAIVSASSCTSRPTTPSPDVSFEAIMELPVTIADASADDDITDPTFALVQRRKRKPESSSPPVTVMGPPPPLVRPPSKTRKHTTPRYSFDPATNNWADGKGSFTPFFDLPTVSRFSQLTVSLDTSSASAHLTALANDRAAASSLLRQIQVWAYTDPAIAALDAKPRSNERLRFHRLVARLRKTYDFSTSDSEFDSSQ